jgi:hypothetical protein
MTSKRVRSLSIATFAAWLAACASTPPPSAEPSASPPAASAKPPGHVWSGVTEAEVAASLDKKFEEAARGYVKVKKDGALMFCKRYCVLGSSIPTIQCITEAQLRTQVENMDQYRERMRTAGKCPHGPQGCSAF